MLLQSLHLNNFGPYRGTHQIAFSTDVEHPITLIGGKNGAGKTSIIDALLLAIYGPRAKHRLGFDHYSAFLASLIYKGERTSEVRLEFLDDAEGQESHYSVNRSWQLKNEADPTQIKEMLTVEIDGEPIKTFSDEKIWSEHMDQILPLSIAGLVIFDGEKIEELAAPEASAAALRDYVEGLLGLDLIERLTNDLKSFQNRVVDSVALKADDDLNNELKLRQRALVEAQDVFDTSELAYQTALDSYHQVSNELAKAEEEFEAQGGELFQRRQELTDDNEAANQELIDAKVAAQRFAHGNSPLLLVQPLLGLVAEIGNKALEAEQLELLFVDHKERDERMLEEIENLLASERFSLPNGLKLQGKETTETAGQQTLAAAIRRLFADDRQNYEQSYQPPFTVTSETTRFASDIAGVGGDQLRSEITEVLENLRSAESHVDDAQRIINSIPNDGLVQDSIQKLANATREHVESEQKLEDVADSRRENEIQFERRRREFERVAEQVLESESATRDQVRIGREVYKAQEVLERFKEKIARKNIADIRANILESLTSLYRKDSLIEDLQIDTSTYEIALFDRDGRDVAQSRLSAGERQILATGQLWGLAKSTSRRLPTVIDTPVGRLDSSHRTHLVERYFPNASHQVILLSTDEEIVGDYQEALLPAVGKMYLLEHEEGTGSSRINEGYFS